MRRTGSRTARSSFALLAAAAAVCSGLWVVLGVSHVSSQGLPRKSCVDPHRSNQIAQPGDTLQCSISVAGLFVQGQSFWVQPLAPSGAEISRGGCAGVSGGSAPLSYSTSAGDNGGLGTPRGACIFSVASGVIEGDAVIGTELVTIPMTSAPGSTVSQQTKECLTATSCGPFTTMIVNGPGSCVGSTAIPVLGGCDPLPAGGPPPKPNPDPNPRSPTPSPGSTALGGANNSSTNTAVKGVSAASLPFTAGPPHPFPVGPLSLTLLGIGVAFFGAIDPTLRRGRHERSGRRRGGSGSRAGTGRHVNDAAGR